MYGQEVDRIGERWEQICGVAVSWYVDLREGGRFKCHKPVGQKAIWNAAVQVGFHHDCPQI